MMMWQDQITKRNDVVIKTAEATDEGPHPFHAIGVFLHWNLCSLRARCCAKNDNFNHKSSYSRHSCWSSFHCLCLNTVNVKKPQTMQKQLSTSAGGTLFVAWRASAFGTEILEIPDWRKKKEKYNSLNSSCGREDFHALLPLDESHMVCATWPSICVNIWVIVHEHCFHTWPAPHLKTKPSFWFWMWRL